MIHSGEWFAAQALSAVRHQIASRDAEETVERRVTLNGWTGIEETLAHIRLPRGYRFALLRRDEVPALIEAVKIWFPEIEVGGASCYLREDFFVAMCFLWANAKKMCWSC
jgi:hypothetical protein